MNEALRVDHAMHDFGPRPKRIKTDLSRVGDIHHSNFPTNYHLVNGQSPPHINGLTNGLPHIADHRIAIDTARLGAFNGPPVQSSPPASSHITHSVAIPARSRPPHVNPRDPINHDTNSFKPQAQLASSQYKADLSTAPTDAVELVWWLRQKMNHIASSAEVGLSTDPNHHASDPNTPQSSSAPPQVSYHEADTEKEKERLRQENRVRKQRWRQDNQERNKDNDLRCRVNKIAKTKFGGEDSPDKAAFIEHEFQLRRAKREVKLRNKAHHSGTIPAFNSADGPAGDLHSNIQANLDPTVESTGHALMSLQHGAGPGNHEVSGSEIEAARKVRADIDSGMLSNDQFRQAAIFAQRNRESTRPSHIGLVHWQDGEERRESGGIEAPGLLMARPAPHLGARQGLEAPKDVPQSFTQTPVAAASALNGMVANRSYASPYGNPEGSSTLPLAPTNGFATKERNIAHSLAERHDEPEQKRHDDDESTPLARSVVDNEAQQVNALLTAAGALSDDDDDSDDDHVVDGDRDSAINGNGSHYRGVKRKGKNADASRALLKNKITKSRASNLPPGANPYDEGPEEQYIGARTRRMYEGSDIEVNTIVPVAKAQAASKINSAPNGEPAETDTSNTNGHPHHVNGSSQSTPLKRSNEDEQQKIRTYGFPPKPKGLKGKGLAYH